MSIDGNTLFRPRSFWRPANHRQGPLSVSKSHPAHPNQPFRPLPPPTGRSPFHMTLADILPPQSVEAILRAGRLAFHVTGDVGGVKMPEPQRIVATHLARDSEESGAAGRPVPAFLYLLGDIVYYFGAAAEYQTQFYDPYIHYPAPIVAVPGNHDGDVDPHDPHPTLVAFVQNFCTAAPHLTPEAGDSSREAMSQPNMYWTFITPFVTIVGLYTNVPEGGQLDDHQIAWLQAELAGAPKDTALVLMMHHPIFSGDAFHSGSQYMQDILDTAVQNAGRGPDAVFAGHVHNYQRYTRTDGGRQVPYVVAGAGGYWHLHAMAPHNGASVVAPLDLSGGLTLESFSQDRHGFLHLEVSRAELRGDYYTVPRPQESWSSSAQLLDSFVVDLRTHQLSQNGTHAWAGGVGPHASPVPTPAADGGVPIAAGHDAWWGTNA